MSRIDEIRDELEKELGYPCVIVKLQTYNHDVGIYRKQKAEIEKYKNALEEIMEAKTAEAMRDIAEEAL